MKFTIALMTAAAATTIKYDDGWEPQPIDARLVALVADSSRPAADRLTEFLSLPVEAQWELGYSCHYGCLNCEGVTNDIEQYCGTA